MNKLFRYAAAGVLVASFGMVSDYTADAAIVDTISKWRFSPATDSNGKPVASSKTEYIDFKN